MDIQRRMELRRNELDRKGEERLSKIYTSSYKSGDTLKANRVAHIMAGKHGTDIDYMVGDEGNIEPVRGYDVQHEKEWELTTNIF